MPAKVVWLFTFVILYWAYCIYWGIRGARMARTASDYFIAGRKLPVWVYVLAATATSYSGWTFMGQPALIFRDGFPFSFVSFYTIMIPLTGIVFLKRQWMLGKRFGYVTPGEMLADYFQSNAVRLLTVVVALIFSIPYLGLQLAASGYLFDVLTDGLIDRYVGAWILALVILVYVASGGLRAVAYVDTAQAVLLWLGIVVIGIIALNAVGGWSALMEGLARLADSGVGRWGTTQGHGGGDYNAFFAIPGVIQDTAGLGRETPVGGPWTSTMIFTFLIGTLGIQAAPAFSMWAFSNTDPEPFAPQAVWASAAWIGGTLMFFTVFQGVSAQLLGADPLVNQAGLALSTTTLPASLATTPDELVPRYLNLLAGRADWLIGFLAVCALAAMQSTGAAYMTTAGGILTRDLYKRYLNQSATHTTQKLFGRLGVAFIVVCAMLVATYSDLPLVLLGGLAVAFGLQMWVPLLAVCYFPWITRGGATWGLIAGVLAVALTDAIGPALFGAALPWGRWPLTIHSAGWGIVANGLVCVLVSALTQHPGELRHRLKFHLFLRQHAGLSTDKRRLIPIAWLLVIGWFVFAIGPGAVIGNGLFGAPDGGRAGWLFGIPSIWAWQILFWALGVAMLWFLAYKLEMATLPSKRVEALMDDAGDGSGTIVR